MNRRNFLTGSLLAGGAFALNKSWALSKMTEKSSTDLETKVTSRSGGKVLNAFYYRAHTYTLVPKQVKEDLRWMADVGTNLITVAILEQDFEAAYENIAFICSEAEKLGIGVVATPSRWAGLLAGSPKVPSIFTILNPDTWICDKNGKPSSNTISGRISSIHHPKTYEFMEQTIDKMFTLWNLKGVMWDELKTISMDYSPMAIKRLGKNPTLMQQVEANVDFYSRLNSHIKEKFPDKTTNLFIYSNFSDDVVRKMSEVQHLDYYGCDGRAWRIEDGGTLEEAGKVLLGNQGQRFIDAAHANHKKSLFLMENHNMANADVMLLQKRMPELLQMDIDQLIYYYYPRNLEDPDRSMNIIKEQLLTWK